jgi:hypothetical protein
VEVCIGCVLTHEERIRSDMAGADELDHVRVIELTPKVDFVATKRPEVDVAVDAAESITSATNVIRTRSIVYPRPAPSLALAMTINFTLWST